MPILTLAGFENYTFTGDVIAIAVCIIVAILINTAYVSRTKSFRIFQTTVVAIVIAAAVNIVYHVLVVEQLNVSNVWIYIVRIIYQMCLFDVLFLFALYITEVSGMEHKKARVVAISATALFVLIIFSDIMATVLGYGFRITDEGITTGRTNMYVLGYIVFVIFLSVLMTRVHHLIYRRVMFGFYGTMALSIFLRMGQMFFRMSSLTTVTYVFPIIAMMYIMHSNPYDVKIGALDVRVMESMVRDLYEKKEEFVYLSLYLPDFDEEGKEFPDDIRAATRKISIKYFKSGTLFQVGHGRMVLVAPKKRNRNYEDRIKKILYSFNEQYEIMRYPYKIVIGESIDEISSKNEYASLIDSVEDSIIMNTVHRVNKEDIARFNREEYILKELTDIHKKRDFNDPRVMAYCQPVYNIKTGQFDTAEALMRLYLDETGLINPYEFIPLAEEYGFIHTLTEIILNKTCRALFELSKSGYKISRISVNVSVTEIKDKGFCGDIKRILHDNRVSGENIAIEITESGNEEDFMIMKDKIEELKEQGITFYLDDFGTGYSNMQRIMELPFDIIKFDRSLVIASGTGKRSEKIVENLANMFKDMNYSILYEGVEDNEDEQRCREMSASYLQGFKYSRPLPIERLREFLQKA